ncbi:NTP transferase domain-containing protein [Ponticaulis sp.]|uniref:NTP transferase domain-containing protein n=1 Tax=Ponticaulis sp. TaxID=2020902 RepID=UPI000B74DC93|nr:NTP transferase domain-containing protein [Ponticaulis sp.]MAI89509.1 xanthine dehydrogenase [Ponticaulis sp.]OUY00544.1 MAG: hypothetical protein CBB65_03635 [Hyphomonadaceae bacterium TMED5]|tara:strand:+ start:169927 stop:171468 length:1542 start_codon:yes stop_codon:yes gene_type:complete
MIASPHAYDSHVLDVVSMLLSWVEAGEKAALALITETQGGGVRAPGALMAISEKGKSCGYLSGGCIDQDVIGHAQTVIETGCQKSLHYGAGSPFLDLPLPCGGAIHLTIIPATDISTLLSVRDELISRSPVGLDLDESRGLTISKGYLAETAQFTYAPKLRLRISGRGADCLALARLGSASGYDIHLQLPDPDDYAAAQNIGTAKLELLTTPDTLPDVSDDAWTAFVLMFHDRHWEVKLLQQSLQQNAFFIGAVGSRRTHLVRCQDLSESGVPSNQIARIHGPVGLVPSLRDSSSIAVSALAEIISCFQKNTHNVYANSACILLAAGQSVRFENGDKLLAELDGLPVLKHTAALCDDKRFKSKIGITGRRETERQSILRQHAWNIVENVAAQEGLASSLRLAIQVAQAQADIQSALVLLGDMPFVPSDHIERLYQALEPGVSAVISRNGDVICPPALFSRAVFENILAADGDRGANAIFKDLQNTRIVDLDTTAAADIDTVSDLKRLEGTILG